SERAAPRLRQSPCTSVETRSTSPVLDRLLRLLVGIARPRWHQKRLMLIRLGGIQQLAGVLGTHLTRCSLTLRLQRRRPAGRRGLLPGRRRAIPRILRWRLSWLPLSLTLRRRLSLGLPLSLRWRPPLRLTLVLRWRPPLRLTLVLRWRLSLRLPLSLRR